MRLSVPLEIFCMLVVQPIREDEAEGEMKQIMDEIKEALEVPALPVVFVAFAEIPALLHLVWERVKPLSASEAFVRDAPSLRYRASDAIRRSYFTPDHVSALVRA